jgi:hypothetical protein
MAPDEARGATLFPLGMEVARRASIAPFRAYERLAASRAG